VIIVHFSNWPHSEPKFDLKYGLVVDISDITDEHEKVTLTADGIRMLAEHGNRFLRISREAIEDRSKADFIQKGLVIVQVSWMAIQCIARKAYGLPLTLLEIHTMIHVVCALIMYLFWMEVSCLSTCYYLWFYRSKRPADRSLTLKVEAT
jgi:hypothetical protein